MQALAVLATFYVMIIRPMRQDQEKHKQHIRDLRPGDDVLTTSGFIARVKDIQVQESGPTHIALELADGVVFTAVTSAIAERLAPRQSAATAAERNGAAP